MQGEQLKKARALFFWQDFAAFLKAFEPVSQLFNGDGDINFMTFAVSHADDLLDLLAVATGCTQQIIGELQLDETIQLTEAVFTVNADFLLQRVMPQFNQTIQAVTTKAAGQAQSAN